MLAVIGSAGRQQDAKYVTTGLYDAMYDETLRAMRDWGSRRLTSGGAAFADHLAVRAFNAGEAEALSLFLPAPFARGRFVRPNYAANSDWSTANRYHEQFSRACGVDSLAELEEAIARGAAVVVRGGFKARNLDVAEAARAMLAFTFGADREPEDLPGDHPGFRDHREAGLRDGGTAHTWNECWRAEVKRHVSLSWLARRLAAEPAAAPCPFPPPF